MQRLLLINCETKIEIKLTDLCQLGATCAHFCSAKDAKEPALTDDNQCVMLYVFAVL